MRETGVRSLGREDPLEKEMATHSSILAWNISWMEELGWLLSMGSQRVGHNWATSLSLSLSLSLEQAIELECNRVSGSKTWTVNLISYYFSQWLPVPGDPNFVGHFSDSHVYLGLLDLLPLLWSCPPQEAIHPWKTLTCKKPSLWKPLSVYQPSERHTLISGDLWTLAISFLIFSIWLDIFV